MHMCVRAKERGWAYAEARGGCWMSSSAYGYHVSLKQSVSPTLEACYLLARLASQEAPIILLFWVQTPDSQNYVQASVAVVNFVYEPGIQTQLFKLM